MPESLLTFDQVSKVFGTGPYTVKALQEVSFTMAQGEILGVIGESGSGKSTIAKLATGLHKITEGAIYFNGKEISRNRSSQWRKVYTDMQMVFQNAFSSFNPRRKIGLSIAEVLCLLCMEKGTSVQDKVVDLLEQVGLKGEYKDKFPHQLSGGECQRAAIARAMAVHPRLLICDEATSALDVSAQAQIVELLLKLREDRGMGILFITHDLPLISTFAQRLLIMNGGQIVERGETRSVIRDPKTPYTRALLDAIL